jgi:hypothetical protein
MKNTFLLCVVFCAMIPNAPVRAADDEDEGESATTVDPAALSAAREKGLDWLVAHQQADGSWGNTYTVAVTSFACLSFLSAADEPFTGERGRTLVRGLEFLLTRQEEGMFRQQGHTWIHGQGFATLALSEAYGRSLSCRSKPDIDMDHIRDVVQHAVQTITQHQSTSGGWWYTQGSPGNHEGSTTVCAVQALVSAANYDIEIDQTALTRGFAYLKQCQNEDGGFDYKLGDAVSMKEGTAGGVATLALMKKFDFAVMVNGYRFLIGITPATISAERFPYYGHFYGTMGMLLLGQEFGQDETYRTTTAGYIAGTQADLLSWQQEDGAWPAKAWVLAGGSEGAPYATAFACMTLSIPEQRLSIYNRPPVQQARLPGLNSLRIIDDHTVAVKSDGLLQLINEAGSLYDDRHYIEAETGRVLEKSDARPPTELTFTTGQACELGPGYGLLQYKLLRIEAGRAVFRHISDPRRDVGGGLIDETISVAPYEEGVRQDDQ